MSDISIAQSIQMHHINEVAAKLNIPSEELEHYGKYKAKLPLHLIREESIKKSNLILVTALTPTPARSHKRYYHSLKDSCSKTVLLFLAPSTALLKEGLYDVLNIYNIQYPLNV